MSPRKHDCCIALFLANDPRSQAWWELWYGSSFARACGITAVHVTMFWGCTIWESWKSDSQSWQLSEELEYLKDIKEWSLLPCLSPEVLSSLWVMYTCWHWQLFQGAQQFGFRAAAAVHLYQCLTCYSPCLLMFIWWSHWLLLSADVWMSSVSLTEIETPKFFFPYLLSHETQVWITQFLLKCRVVLCTLQQYSSWKQSTEFDYMCCGQWRTHRHTGIRPHMAHSLLNKLWSKNKRQSNKSQLCFQKMQAATILKVQMLNLGFIAMWYYCFSSLSL